MTAETWPIRVADVARIVDEVARKKVYDRRSSPTP
jgi:hypothetical protein